jgi:PEGA domain
MRREAVRNILCAVAFAILFLGSGATRGSCQSTSSPVDDPQTKSKVEFRSSTSSSASSGGQATDQQDQSSKLNRKEKPDKGKTHIRLGTVTVGASYTRFSNGFLVPFWGYGFYPYYFGYEPFFYDPFYSSYFYEPYTAGFAYGPDKGEVRLEAKPSSASVYLNDAYAGTAGKLKHMWLSPGAYDLTVAAPDGSEFHQRIYVLSGKSLKIHAKIVAPNE